jgi:hypothetical protein
VETVEKSKSNNDFPTVPPARGNPAKVAGFPHFRSADGDDHLSTAKNFTHPRLGQTTVGWVRRALKAAVTLVTELVPLQLVGSKRHL